MVCAEGPFEASFDLLGLQFIPRLRDAAGIRLYLRGAPTGLPVDAILRGRARPQPIRAHYDDVARMAASLISDGDKRRTPVTEPTVFPADAV